MVRRMKKMQHELERKKGSVRLECCLLYPRGSDASLWAGPGQGDQFDLGLAMGQAGVVAFGWRSNKGPISPFFSNFYVLELITIFVFD
jgi:hypothetical protein